MECPLLSLRCENLVLGRTYGMTFLKVICSQHQSGVHTFSAGFHVVVGNLTRLGSEVSEARRIIRLGGVVDADVGKVGVAGADHGPKE